MPPIVLLAVLAIAGLLLPSSNSDKKVTPPEPPKKKTRWVKTGRKSVKRKKAKEAKPDADQGDPA